MCGCCCSNIDYDYGREYYRWYDENDIYSFSKLDGEELFSTYYYDFRNNEILRKDKYGRYCRIRSLMTREGRHDNFSKTHCMLTDKNGKILIYDYENLKNWLKEAYSKNTRNILKEEVRKELLASEPLLSL